MTYNGTYDMRTSAQSKPCVLNMLGQEHFVS